MDNIVLKTDQLTKYYGSKLVVDHVNLKIPKGSIYGFLGRNGAGKTTIMKILMGFLKPTFGRSEILGADSENIPPEVRQKIGYITEGHRLFPWMTIGEIAKFQRAFHQDTWDEEKFSEMLEYFELRRKQKIKHISNGQRAQISLALTLAPNPEVLLMDDPTLGLDVAIRRQFLEGVIKLVMGEGKTVFFSSHILTDVERIAERLIIIDKGIITADCSVETFRSSIRKVIIPYKKKIASVDIEGLITYSQNEKELSLVLISPKEETLEAFVTKIGAEKYFFGTMDLEKQFIEFTSPKKRMVS